MIGQGVDVGPELPPGHRIDPRGGFIEEQQRRLVEQGAGEGQALAQAKGQGFRLLAEPGAEGERLHHGVDARLLLATEQAVDAGEERQVLGHGELLVEGELLGHVAEVLTRRRGAAGQIDAGHQRLSAARAQQAALHLEGGGLARAVGAEQAEDLPPAHREADVVGGGEIPEPFGEAARLDHRLRGDPLGQAGLAHQLRQAGLPTRAAAEQIDKGIFQPGRGRH